MEKLCLFVEIIDIFSIPRCVFCSEGFVNLIELHGFAHSSNQA